MIGDRGVSLFVTWVGHAEVAKWFDGLFGRETLGEGNGVGCSLCQLTVATHVCCYIY